MAEKNPITRAQALENVLVLLTYATTEDVKLEGFEEISWTDTANVVHKMLTQLKKPRAAQVSKARIANESLAKKVAQMIPDEGITNKGITYLGIPEIASTQKATAVMTVAIELGLVNKVTEKKVTTYYRTDNTTE